MSDRGQVVASSVSSGGVELGPVESERASGPLGCVERGVVRSDRASSDPLGGVSCGIFKFDKASSDPLGGVERVCVGSERALSGPLGDVEHGRVEPELASRVWSVRWCRARRLIEPDFRTVKNLRG